MKKLVYFGLIGNFFMLAGMLCSFLMIKTGETADHTARIFARQSWGPAETAEEQTAQEEKEEETLEVKGYTYSLAGYLCQRIPEKDSADIDMLRRISEYMDSNQLAQLDASDPEQMALFSNISDAERILDYYGAVDGTGLFVVVLSVISIAVSIVLVWQEDYKWSLIFSLIGTMPLWVLLVKLDGITSWQTEYGCFFFVGGLLIVLAACLAGEGGRTLENKGNKENKKNKGRRTEKSKFKTALFSR